MLPLALSAEVAGVIAAVVFGVPTLVFGVIQIRAGRFRLKVEALLAEAGDSLRVKVTNQGSVEGAVHGLGVVDAEGHRVDLTGAGESFEEIKLSAGSSREIDFNAPEGRDFQPNDTVVIRWGKRVKRLKPTPVQGSFYRAKDEPSEPAAPPGEGR